MPPFDPLNPRPPESSDAQLETRGLDVFYGSFQAVKSVSIAFPACAITAIIGPSGCGKSTLLRVLSGLLQPTT